jgi:hypothetical protein
MAALEKESRPGSAAIANPVAIRRAADHTAADNGNLLLDLQQVERGLNDMKVQTEPVSQLRSGQFAREMQRLQRELQDQIER